MSNTVGIIITTNGHSYLSPWMKDRIGCQSYGRDNIQVIIIDYGFQDLRYSWSWADVYIHAPGQSIGKCRSLGIQEGFRLNVTFFAFWKETYYYRWNFLEKSINLIAMKPILPFHVRPFDAFFGGGIPLITLCDKGVTRTSIQNYLDYSIVVSASYFLHNPHKLTAIQNKPLLDVFSKDECSIIYSAITDIVAIEPYSDIPELRITPSEEAYFRVLEVLRNDLKHPLITFSEGDLCLLC